jgi:hypothetical protein
MRSKRSLLFFAALFLVLPVLARAGEQESRTQIVVPMKNGAFVAFNTEITPASSEELAFSFMESESTPNLIHRYFVDKNEEHFFGYELLIEPVGERKQFRFTVRALSAEFQERLRARKAFQTRRLHPGSGATAFPSAPQLVGDGDRLVLDVLYNPRTGAKISDIITVSFDDPRLQSAPEIASEPRDFSPSDMQLKITNYSLRVNGESVWRSAGGCSGALIWFSLGERGRFVFSLVPRPGYDFRKVGKVEHNKISFEWGEDRYEWVSQLPVVGGGGTWNLWVLHDPDYKFGIYDDQPPPGVAKEPGLDETVRRAARLPKNRAGFGAPAAAQRPQPTMKRARVAIGAANAAESILPQPQTSPSPPQ